MSFLDLAQHRGDTVHDHLFVKVFSVACFTIGTEWNYANVCSGYWRLYRNDRAGASLILADGTRYPVGPGDLHFVPSWVRFDCHNTRKVESLYAHFDLIGVTAATVRRLFRKPTSVPCRPPLDAWCDHLAGELRQRQRGNREPHLDPALLCQAKGLIYGALGELFHELRAELLPDALMPISPALQHIEHHLGTLMTNPQLAALCHCSEDHFVRLFRQQVGRTPAQYILERRIAAATHELAFSRRSIEEIAAQLGFANRYHFTRMFTRRMQISPAAYRKQSQV